MMSYYWQIGGVLPPDATQSAVMPH